MKNYHLWLPVIILLNLPGTLKAQDKLLPIDSLYMNSLEAFYQFADENKDKIWPGMKMYPVCLYRLDGPAFLYNHPDPPASFQKIAPDLYLGWQKAEQLMGATQTEINGVLTAIAGYEGPDWQSVEEVLSVLFHELHHVYQRQEVNDLVFENPADLMMYPEHPQNDALKLFEQNLLYQMVFTTRQDELTQLLDLFYSSRMQRQQLIGNYIEYEKAVENIEGPATYCEYRMHRKYSARPDVLKENYYHRYFWAGLTTPYYGRQNLRYRHLSSGLAMSVLLDRLNPDWKKEYYASGKNLQDLLFEHYAPSLVELPDISSLQAISGFHTARIIAGRNNEFDQFFLQPGMHIILKFSTSPGFRGFDPMSAQAVDPHTIIHKTLNLAKDSHQLFVQNRQVVTRVKNQIWIVDKLELFVPESALEVTEDSIMISDQGISLQWEGQLLRRDASTVEFLCK